MTNEDNVIYLTPKAIRDHFETQIESGSDMGKFISNADDKTLSLIGSTAYWDDRIWDAFKIVLDDAAAYVYKKHQHNERNK